MEQDRSRLTAVAQCLVDLGAGVSAVDNEGRTALHLAAGCGDRDMVKKLVELGGDINALDHMGGAAPLPPPPKTTDPTPHSLPRVCPQPRPTCPARLRSRVPRVPMLSF